VYFQAKRNILQTDIYAPSKKKTLRNIYWFGCSAYGMWKEEVMPRITDVNGNTWKTSCSADRSQYASDVCRQTPASHGKERQLTKITLVITKKNTHSHYPICGHDTHTTHTHKHTPHTHTTHTHTYTPHTHTHTPHTHTHTHHTHTHTE